MIPPLYDPTAPSEPSDPSGVIARRTLLGVLGTAFGGALGIAFLGASRNLPPGVAAADEAPAEP